MPANGESRRPRISSDGRYVVFDSTASNLVPKDDNGCSDVFLLDRKAGTIERVSVDSGEVEGDDASERGDVSEDGRTVVFESIATELIASDFNGKKDVFLRDRVLGTTTLLSSGEGGAGADDDSSNARIHVDGSVVAFESLATNLVNGDTNGVADVFLCAVSNGAKKRVSLHNNGSELTEPSVLEDYSADGRWLVFRNTGAVEDHGFNTANQIFLSDLTQLQSTLVSVGIDGLLGDHHSHKASFALQRTSFGTDAVVSFVSNAGNLTVAPRNAIAQTYVRNVTKQVTQMASVDSAGLSSAFHSEGPAVLVPNSLDLVFTHPGSDLVSGDTNQAADVFRRPLFWAFGVEIGVGLSGSGGFVPHLFAEGGSCEAGAWKLRVEQGLGRAFGFLWVGLSETDGIPFLGGQFYVDLGGPFWLFRAALGGPAGVPGAGTLEMPGTDAGAIAPLLLVMQGTFLDAAAPQGVSLSNALDLYFAR